MEIFTYEIQLSPAELFHNQKTVKFTNIRATYEEGIVHISVVFILIIYSEIGGKSSCDLLSERDMGESYRKRRHCQSHHAKE